MKSRFLRQVSLASFLLAAFLVLTGPFESALADGVLDQNNAPPWYGAWTNILAQGKRRQVFKPGKSPLVAVEVNLITGNPGYGDDSITLAILDDQGNVLTSNNLLVSDGFDGWLHFDIPGDGLVVDTARNYIIHVEDAGKLTFGWRYSWDTYPDGWIMYSDTAEYDSDFFFKTYTSESDPDEADWTNIGPAGGEIVAVVVDPKNPQTVYAGTFGGGIFKSTNGGAGWQKVWESAYAVIHSLAVDPKNTRTLYAGASHYGLLKSTDGGASWSLINTGLTNLDDQFIGLAVDPQNTQVVYLGAFAGGVFKSTNGGASWKQVNSDLSYSSIRSLAIDRKNKQTVYVGTDDGVFKSTNGGTGWLRVKTGAITSSLVVDPANSQTVYAGTYGGVFKSTDGGISWEAVNSGLTDWGVSSLAIDAKNSRTIYASAWSGGGIFKSLNAGVDWEQINSGLTNTHVFTLAINPKNTQTVYGGTRGGVFRSVNGGAGWKQVKSGMIARRFPTLALYHKNPQIVYAGTYGDGVFKSVNGGRSWKQVNSGLTDIDIHSLAVHPGNPQIVYVGTQYGGVFKSINGGANWKRAGTSSLTGSLVYALAIDPKNPATVYAGTYYGGVFKSTNGGDSWGKINSGLNNIHIRILTVDPKSTQTVYTGTLGGGLFKSTDGGANWKHLDSDHLSSGIYAFAIDPVNTQILYSHGNGIVKSTDGGENWEKIDSDASPMCCFTALAIDPRNTQTVYAGTNGLGVFLSTDGGENWQPINAGLTNKLVSALAIDSENPQTVYAGTNGGSLFKRGGTICPKLDVPSGPLPTDGATGLAAASVQLNWAPSSDASQYDVYFGTSSNPPLVETVTATTYTLSTLSEGGIYYWRVVARNGCGHSTSGPVWSFTTGCSIPGVPSNPWPADGASGVTPASLQLTWTPAFGATEYDVFLGTSSKPQLVATVSTTGYTPPTLSPGVTYYWGVTAKNGCAAATSGVWSFSTKGAPPP